MADLDPENWHPLGRVFPAELGPTRDRAAAADTRLKVARDLYEAGRCELDEVNAAEKNWEVARTAFLLEARKVGEYARVMLECLASCDPAALVDVLERAGLTAAAERLTTLEKYAEGLKSDLMDAQTELRQLQERIQGGFVALKRLDDRSDEPKGKAGPKRAPAWQAI